MSLIEHHFELNDTKNSPQVVVEGQISASNKMNNKEKTSRGHIFEYLTTCVHVTFVGFILIIFFLCFTNELILFTWHPILLSIGWVLLMTEGVLILAPYNVLTKRLPYNTKVQYHWIIQSTAVGCGLLGFIVIYINKNLKEKPHFHSWHGLLGLISVICCLPACTSGLLALYCMTFKNYIKPVNTKLIHRLCGILTFLIGSVTTLLSLYTNWFQRNTHECIPVIMFILMSFTMIWSIRHASIRVLKRLTSII